MPVVAGYPITFNAGDASEIVSLGSGASVQNATVLEGAFSLKQAGTFSLIDSGLNLNTLGLRFLLRLPALPSTDLQMLMFNITGSVQILALFVRSTGILWVQGSNGYGLVDTFGTTALAINTTYTVSIATNVAAGGIITVWLGSTQELTTTHGSLKTGITEIKVAGLGAPNETIFDDFYLIDTAELPPLTDITTTTYAQLAYRWRAAAGSLFAPP